RAPRKSTIQRLWKKSRFEFLIWGTILLFWLLISLTRIGIEPDDRFWNVAGVPILPQQLILSGLLLLLLLDLSHRYSVKWGKHLAKPASAYLLIGVIWLGTFMFWQGTELKHTYFAPDPYAPNYARYPFSDARAFDIGGQAFLQGFGLNNNITTDRPFLMTFTALLHAIGGQGYDQYIKIQVAILALIPALLFVLGWKYHSKTAGLGIALLMILQQGNAIRASAEIGLVNAKVLMSELPTALLLIAITIYLLQWLEKRDSLLSPLITGGLLGLAVGVRGNTLVLIPVVLAIVLVKYLLDSTDIKRWVQTSGVFILGLAVVLGPYSIRSYQQDGTVFWLSKIQDVIQRSELEGNEGDNGGARLPKLVNPERVFSDQSGEPGLLSYALNHFMHNEINSVLIYPLDWHATPLASAVEHPVWDYDQDWQGQLTNGEKVTLGINLLVISFGIGFAFRRHGLAGIVPLLFHLAYNLSNALSRTSGGRYLVPVEWVVIVYYLLGVISIYFVLRTWQPSQKPDHSQTSGILVLDVTVLTGIVLLGISFMFSDLIPVRFPDDSQSARIALLEDYGQDWIEQSGLRTEDLRSFITSDRAVLQIGLVLYPRFYPGGEIPIRSSHVPVMPHDQNRVTFVIMEKDSVDYVHLGLGSGRVSQFPHAAYGLLLGCQKEDYIDGIVFIPMTEAAPEIVEQADLALSCEIP
ncbi:MAG: hypothetical protein P8Y68_16940, partial [Anaerolineales bacterium]